jgi:hypothetical protein
VNIRQSLRLLVLTVALLPTTLLATSGGGVCTSVVLGNTDCTPNALNGPVGHITDTLLTVAGAVAVIIIIIGGISYITSAGDSSRIKVAKDTILYAVIGLVVVIIAYAIVNFVITNI